MKSDVLSVLDSLWDDMDEVDLVARLDEVGERPVDHVLALRRAIDGDVHVVVGDGEVHLHFLVGTLVEGAGGFRGGGGDLRGGGREQGAKEGEWRCMGVLAPDTIHTATSLGRVTNADGWSSQAGARQIHSKSNDSFVVLPSEQTKP